MKLKIPVAPAERVTAPPRLSVLAKSPLRVVEMKVSRAMKFTGVVPLPTVIAPVAPMLSRPKPTSGAARFTMLVPPKVGAALVTALGESSSEPPWIVVGPVYVRLP